MELAEEAFGICEMTLLVAVAIGAVNMVQVPPEQLVTVV